MKRFAALTAVLLLIAVVTVVSAQEKEAPAADHGKITAIDSETKVKFQKLKLQYELDMVDLNAEKAELHEEMMTELLKKESSTKTIEKLGKSMNGVQYKMHKAKIDYVLKVKKVLPADHWKMFLNKQSCSTKADGHPHGGVGHKCSSSCSHSATKCPMAGAKGHVCTVACTHSAAGTGCKTPCVKIKK